MTIRKPKHLLKRIPPENPRPRLSCPVGVEREWRTFYAMIHRVDIGQVSNCHWDWTLNGFYEFLNCVELMPDTLERPSIGRINHSKGYEPGNVEWQDYIENVTEARHRTANSPKRKYTEERSREQSERQMGKKMPPFSDEHRKRLSLAAKRRYAHD